jgi:hypothetical protein
MTGTVLLPCWCCMVETRSQIVQYVNLHSHTHTHTHTQYNTTQHNTHTHTHTHTTRVATKRKGLYLMTPTHVRQLECERRLREDVLVVCGLCCKDESSQRPCSQRLRRPDQTEQRYCGKMKIRRQIAKMRLAHWVITRRKCLRLSEASVVA